MNEEPQPEAIANGPLDKQLQGLKFIWLGMVLGGWIILAMLGGVVVFWNQPFVDFGDLAYLFLIPVPIALMIAYLVLPMMPQKDPAAIVKSQEEYGEKPNPRWEVSNHDKSSYWFPLYSSGFFTRFGLLPAQVILSQLAFS